MNYPIQLEPTTIEEIEIPSGNKVLIPKATPIFEKWSVEKVTDTYNNKLVLDFMGEPAFAEIVILKIFQKSGWDGVWVDTYHNKFRTSYWPKNSVEIPPEHKELLHKIYNESGANKGCWDVFCWKNGLYCFAESKRHGRDKIRDSQRQWLEAAIKCGLPLTSFIVVEWEVKIP